jgi:opacity protein-like surface antigen
MPFLLLVILLVSMPAFAQETQGVAQGTQASGSGWVDCPTGQQYVYLYRTVTHFEVLSSPKCDEKVELLGRETAGTGYYRVRTADGREGYLPQGHVTTTAPRAPRITITEERPLPPPAAEAPSFPGSVFQGELDVPQIEVFGGYSYLSLDTQGLGSRTGFHGWGASAAYNFSPWLGIEGEVGGHYKPNCTGTIGINCGHLTVMGGPKVTYRNAGITVFGHGLFGLGNMRAGGSETAFAWGGGGGVEIAVSENFSVRAGQADLFVTRYGASVGAPNQNNIRISGGIVYRIGRVVTE